MILSAGLRKAFNELWVRFGLDFGMLKLTAWGAATLRVAYW